MARKSRTWTVCFAVDDPSCDDGFYTATWFAMGKTADEAKENFMSNLKYEHDFCGGDDPKNYHIVRVFEGFSC